jgi:hypothetical protein
MDNRLIQSINHEIYCRFPDLEGCPPRVQAYRPTQNRSLRPRFGSRLVGALGLSIGSPPAAYLLVYAGRKTTSTGKRLPYTVRVVVAENGKILKTTLSH